MPIWSQPASATASPITSATDAIEIFIVAPFTVLQARQYSNRLSGASRRSGPVYRNGSPFLAVYRNGVTPFLPAGTRRPQVPLRPASGPTCLDPLQPGSYDQVKPSMCGEGGLRSLDTGFRQSGLPGGAAPEPPPRSRGEGRPGIHGPLPMIRFENLLEKVRRYSSEADVELLRRAYVFSALEHKGQVRNSGEPYLVHPLEVADFLADMKLDVVAVAAGLLHDVVEDTLTTPERIAELFGREVAHVVEGVTKIGAIPFSSSEERQAENFRKMLLAMVDDIRVILVKLADRLHNMRTLHHLPEERRLKI